MHVRLKPNIFFLVIDSLRQDKCLGKSKTSVTPTLDKLIRNGIFFNQNISTAPITVPSFPFPLRSSSVVPSPSSKP